MSSHKTVEEKNDEQPQKIWHHNEYEHPNEPNWNLEGPGTVPFLGFHNDGSLWYQHENGEIPGHYGYSYRPIRYVRYVPVDRNDKSTGKQVQSFSK